MPEETFHVASCTRLSGRVGIDCPLKARPFFGPLKTWVWLSHNCVNFKFNYTAELPRRFRSRQVDVELDGQGCKTLERNRAGMPPVRGYRRGVAAGGNSPARFHPTQARRGSTLQGDYTNGAVRRYLPPPLPGGSLLANKGGGGWIHSRRRSRG